MSEFLPEPKPLGKVKVELDFSNYVTKTDLKNATGIDTSSFAKKVDLASLKSNVDKLKNIPTNLSNFKSKVDRLGVDKLLPVAADCFFSIATSCTKYKRYSLLIKSIGIITIKHGTNINPNPDA